MPKIVLEPSKIVTDPVVLNVLAAQNIDDENVEFFKDYTSRTNGGSPYVKIYRELKLVGDTPVPTGKRFLASQGLPMCNALGQMLDPTWVAKAGGHTAQYNLFHSEVKKTQIRLVCLSDQPNGIIKKFDEVIWNPQLFIGGSEVKPSKLAAVRLEVDPINPNLLYNTLEWDYVVCKRRIRQVQGKFTERWVFNSSPHVKVKISHNTLGALKLKLGSARDARSMPLKVTVIGDNEIIEASEFDRLGIIYPVIVGADLTVSPDTGTGSTTVDGYASRGGADPFSLWDPIHDGIGTAHNDTGSDVFCVYLQAALTNSYWNNITRGIFTLDTSPLGAGATITSADWSVYTIPTWDVDDHNQNICLVAASPASDDDLVDADYLHTDFGVADYATRKDLGYIQSNQNQYHAWAMNSTGKGAISRTGITKLGMRSHGDVDDGVSWANGASIMYIRWADFGSDKPKLVIAYTPAAPTAGRSLGFIIG